MDFNWHLIIVTSYILFTIKITIYVIFALKKNTSTLIVLYDQFLKLSAAEVVMT